MTYECESALLPAGDFVLDVVNRFYPPDGEVLGVPYHWGKLPFRVFLGEVSIWSGFGGHGKSLFLNQCILDRAYLKQSSLLASFEMPAVKNLYRMARQALGKVNPTSEELYLCMDWLNKYVFVYDKVGTGNLKTLQEVVKIAIDKYGVNYCVIDSLMKCGIDPKDFKSQKDFVDQWQNFAQIWNIHVNIVAHSRKNENEEDKPGKQDVRGAGEITDLADNVYTIWRNKKKEREYQEYFAKGVCNGPQFEKLLLKYDAVVDCDKARELGSEVEGAYGLYFHRPSMQFIEKLGQEPFIYFTK